MVSACHLILQGHLIKWSCHFIGRSPSRLSYHPVKFGGHSHSDSGDIMVFICQETFQDHVIKVLNNFRVRSPLRYVTKLPSLAAIGTVSVET